MTGANNPAQDTRRFVVADDPHHSVTVTRGPATAKPAWRGRNTFSGNLVKLGDHLIAEAIRDIAGATGHSDELGVQTSIE